MDWLSVVPPVIAIVIVLWRKEVIARLLIFSLMIGALLAFIRVSGGVAAMVESLIRRGIARSGRSAALLTSGVGVVVFVESNLSVLTAGILSRGLFDKYGLSRAKLAYIIDSTSAPVCIMILLNGWGAFVLVLLNQYNFGLTSAEVLWGSVVFNFYAILTLATVFVTAATGRYFGPLATSPAGVGVDISKRILRRQSRATWWCRCW